MANLTNVSSHNCVIMLLDPWFHEKVCEAQVYPKRKKSLCKMPSDFWSFFLQEINQSRNCKGSLPPNWSPEVLGLSLPVIPANSISGSCGVYTSRRHRVEKGTALEAVTGGSCQHTRASSEIYCYGWHSWICTTKQMATEKRKQYLTVELRANYTKWLEIFHHPQSL